MLPVGIYFIIFVSLSGEQNYISRTVIFNNPAYRFLAPFDHLAVGAVRYRSKNIANNRTRIFTAAVVTCDDRETCKRCGYSAHNRALGSVSVAAATEYNNNSAVGSFQSKQSFQHIFKCIGCVRIIDKNIEIALFRQRYMLHSPGYLRTFRERRHNNILFYCKQTCRTDRPKCV